MNIMKSLAVAGVVSALVGGCSTSTPQISVNPSPSASSVKEVKPSIHLVFSPHPDDEGQIFPALYEESVPTYTITVLATKGDKTVHCKDGVLKDRVQHDKGVVIPPKDTFEQGSEECMYDRIYLWNKSLDESAEILPALSLGDNIKHINLDFGGKGAEAWIGSKGARFSFNMGDNEVTEKDFTANVRKVLDLRGKELPNLEVRRITAAGYYNGPLDPENQSDLAMVYNHPDHFAVVSSGRVLAGIAKEGADLVTHPFDKRATKVMSMPLEDYHKLMGISRTENEPYWEGWIDPVSKLTLKPGNTSLPDGVVKPVFPYTENNGNKFSLFHSKPNPLKYYHRRGIFQKNYGWLAFPGPWTPSKYQIAGSDSLNPQYSFYIHVDK